MKLQQLMEYNDIVIQCHDNPDADAIASGYALYVYFRDKGKKVRLVYGGRYFIRKSNLKLMVDTLKIPIAYAEEIGEPELLITVDCQYGAGNVTRFSAGQVAVIDHHRKEASLPELSEVKSSLGSCSTLVWQMLREEKADINRMPGVATALYYGLMSDTNGFSEIAHPLDKDLRDSADFSQELITRYRNANISLEEIEIAGAALMQYEYDERYRFAVVKALPCDPNVLGIISDMLLEVDAVDTAMVFSLSGTGVKLSFRSCVKEVKANELAAEICKGMGSGGGHYVKAGGFIRLDALNDVYLDYCADKGLTPRLGMSEDGRRKSITGPAMKSYFMARMRDYFKNSEIIYAREYELDTGNMVFCRERPIELGFVRGRELFPAGTDVTIRTFQEDIRTAIEEDTVIIIGRKGEVYLKQAESFAGEYRINDQPYELGQTEYQPTIRSTAEGRIVFPMARAKVCTPIARRTIRAVKLDHRVKLFPLWDESRYLLGRPGDYLIVQSKDPHDMNIMEREAFEETYQKLDDGREDK